ncbi:acyltransferase [Bradyrhizobium sp. 149]|uniref:acyltransferase family protein n=1 Tax=Bradyrhizobium sp. 149 TaxID=2782624 RepID=UPI001FFAD24A|nr:acyltransferase family protein [Bradyrhizobium sp. 149]MCK1652720.1 acyltransferase [Bradyrhizobium sp. 149]
MKPMPQNRSQDIKDPQAREKRRYRPEIDGLRGIAVLAVVLFHANFGSSNGYALQGGYLGVDIFFVISGYLTGALVLAELRRETFSLHVFYIRRARRILPALFLVLIVTFFLALLILVPRPLVDFSRSLVASIFFVANIFFWWRIDYFSEPGELTPLLHLWSLSLEEQFYLLFPPMLLLVWQRARQATLCLMIVATAVSILLAFLNSAVDPAGTFYFLHYRAWQFLLGGILAKMQADHGDSWRPFGAALPVIGLGLVLCSLVLLGSRGAIGMGSITIAVGTSLIILGDRGPAVRLLTWRPLVWIGLISYSLYLWHQPILALGRSYLVNAPGGATLTLLLSASFALAFLSWRYVEQPFRHAAIDGKQLAASAILTVVTLVAAGLSSLLAGGFPARYSQVQQQLLEITPERGIAYVGGRTCTRRAIADACIIGRPGTKPHFAVLGDSHAETLTGPISDLLNINSAAAYVYTDAGCPFIIGVVEQFGTSRCDEYNNDAFRALKANQVSKVIINDRSTAYILGTRFDNQEGGIEPGLPFPVEPVGFKGDDHARIRAVASQLRETLRLLADNNIVVYYVLPVPEVGWNVPRTLLKLIARGDLPLTTSLAVYLKRNERVFDILDGFKNNSKIIPIYPHETFCSAVSGRCATHENDKIYYTDTDHLSREGAEKLVAASAKLIEFQD